MCGIRQDINVVHVFVLLIVRETLIKSLKIHVKSNSVIESAFPSSYYRREGKDKPVKREWYSWDSGKEHVGGVFSQQCHRKRSRGIFLAHWYNAICATAGKGNPSVKGARKNKVQGRFLAALEMTVWGEWVYFT